tara:strand:+ start:498 stop:1025 length:528 start_codon:yes stop_codon:yes gene_type:complete
MAARPKRASGTKYKIELIVDPIEPKEKITFLFNRSNDSLSSYNIDNEPISASNKSLLRNLAENLIKFDVIYIEKIGNEEMFKEIYTRLYNDLKDSRENLPRPEDISKVSGSADGKVAGHNLEDVDLPTMEMDLDGGYKKIKRKIKKTKKNNKVKKTRAKKMSKRSRKGKKKSKKR